MSSELDHLIKMINQIASNIAIGENDTVASEKVADHIRRFWAKSMKQQIISYVEQGGDQLQPAAIAAVRLLN
ncbi:formate dehydrogenase subunit delta [Oceanicoccus sagamiensis]|uniref:Formate dehydrogenase n=1 Tax=Oceanicoccus sagamiensis TaxID=716816 RepID=A0A1X9ND59_9GAMM|nr:formate dehydrogenase subunit delta [Oceanicoccus sagamiensis]ARN75970.1 hypothetical protein BST96_18840 [Oceanicoccus sagamiensis]